jgi:hypothetical protein
MSLSPRWIDEVTSSIVTTAEGRFGICRILLWFGDGDEADVALPYPQYAEIERSLGPVPDRTVLHELWRRGHVPTSPTVDRRCCGMSKTSSMSRRIEGQ